MVPALIEKGLSAARANTKAKAIEALLYYFEFENAEAVVVRRALRPPAGQGGTRLTATSATRIARARHAGRPHCRLLQQDGQGGGRLHHRAL